MRGIRSGFRECASGMKEIFFIVCGREIRADKWLERMLASVFGIYMYLNIEYSSEEDAERNII